MTGPISLTLYASSSAPDTDFTAKLVDVGPCGCSAMNLTDGIIRARVRESKSEPKLITPGKVYEFTIDMWSTWPVFKAGDRIRLEVSVEQFPALRSQSEHGARALRRRRDASGIADRDARAGLQLVPDAAGDLHPPLIGVTGRML